MDWYMDSNAFVPLSNFREKLTESDTLLISFDHSVCTYQGYERIEITKDNSHCLQQIFYKSNHTIKHEVEKKIKTQSFFYHQYQF